jgi:hypothetical protein
MTMSELGSRLELYVNRETGDYVILNNAVDQTTRFYVEWGRLVSISKAQMESDGLGIVLKNLAGFTDRKSNDCGDEWHEMQRNNPRLFGEFLSKHKCIVIVKDREEERLEFYPLCNPRQYSMKKRISKLPLSCTKVEFLDALRRSESMAF